jgi:hypothetical protein
MLRVPPTPFEARFTLRSLLPRLAAWGALAAVGVAFALPVAPLQDLHFAARIGGGLVALLFGTAMLVELRRLAMPQPVLRIDAEGILWRRWSEQSIPWSEVRAVRLVRVQRTQFAGLVLADPARCPATTVLRHTAKANRAFTGCDLCLEVQGTDRRFDALLAALEAHLPPDEAPRAAGRASP